MYLTWAQNYKAPLKLSIDIPTCYFKCLKSIRPNAVQMVKDVIVIYRIHETSDFKKFETLFVFRILKVKTEQRSPITLKKHYNSGSKCYHSLNYNDKVEMLSYILHAYVSEKSVSQKSRKVVHLVYFCVFEITLLL